MYYLPEYYGLEECLAPVSAQHAFQMEQYCEQIDEESIYQEYFEYILDVENLNYPSSVDEALHLFQRVIELNWKEPHARF